MKNITFIDLDGTLLNDDSKLTSYSKIVLKEYSQKSILIAVTARSKKLVGIDSDIKNLFDGFVFHNGAEIYYNNIQIYKNFLSKNDLKQIWNLLSHMKFKISIITDDTYYANYDASKDWNDIESLRIIDNIDEIIGPVPKLNITVENNNQKNFLESTFNSNKKYRIEFTDNNLYCIIQKRTSNKGIAIKKIINHLNGEFNKTIGIGNDENDICMLLECDEKICVANACDKLKNISDLIIDKNTNDGVAKYLMNSLSYDNEIIIIT